MSVFRISQWIFLQKFKGAKLFEWVVRFICKQTCIGKHTYSYTSVHTYVYTYAHAYNNENFFILKTLQNVKATEDWI